MFNIKSGSGKVRVESFHLCNLHDSTNNEILHSFQDIGAIIYIVCKRKSSAELVGVGLAL